MTVLSVLDAAGRRRSPATLPGYHAGRAPRNKGMRYPADPPTVDEIVAVMRHTRDDRHGRRLRAMIVVLWRAGLRIQEALALTEHDLDQMARIDPGPLRQGWPPPRGRDGRVGLGAPASLGARADRPAGRPAVLRDRQPDPRAPVVGCSGPWRVPAACSQAGVRHRFAPHQLRHAHALELAREGVPLNIIQRQLGHTNLGMTSIYLRGIDPEEIITAVRSRRAPMMSASAGLRL